MQVFKDPYFMCAAKNKEYIFLKKIFIAQTVHTVCKRINYKIAPVNNLNKYLHYGTNGTE